MAVGGNGQFDVIAKVVPVKCTEPAQTIRTARPCPPSGVLLGEHASKPLSESLEVFLVFIIKTYQKVKDEGRGVWNGQL